MVGTLEQSDNSWGLINDPQSIVHRVKVGNYLGQNEGRIVKITETKIYLVEIVPDGVGGYIERDASIAIGNE
jgi:type IV pilus assembly protein PilP